MTSKRLVRNRPLTPEEAAKYQAARTQLAAELPALVERHHERLALLDDFTALFQHLRATRETLGLSLADLETASGIDKAMLSRLENGHVNPTLATVTRYAKALGMRFEYRLVAATAD